MVLNGHLNVNLGGPGVLDGVVQCLLGGKENVVSQTRGKRPVRQLRGYMNPGADPRCLKEPLGEVSQVAEQAIQGVMLRADRPNNLIKFLSQEDGDRAKAFRIRPSRVAAF